MTVFYFAMLAMSIRTAAKLESADDPPMAGTQIVAIACAPIRASHYPPLPMKTNAARKLDTLGISYELRDYEVDEAELSAESVAFKVGLPPSQVFKTLVARGDKTGVLLAVVPGDAELDLKALAKLSGNRKADTVPLKEVQPLTGYIRGGVTALACKKPYPVFVDESIELHDVVSVSAGVRGTQILLSPVDYVRAVAATVGPIAKAKGARN